MRVPVVSTVIVALAVAAMIGLGVWQLLIRMPEKEAQLAQLARNPALPVVAFPGTPDDTLLFRRAHADCRPPITIARAGAGGAGYRLIADCADGVKVQLGTTRDPNRAIDWAGGPVTGRISQAPDPRPLIARLFDQTPAALILIADTPAPGLAANSTPDVSSVANNHFAYAIQWFLFAGIAGIIYALALRKQRKAI